MGFKMKKLLFGILVLALQSQAFAQITGEVNYEQFGISFTIPNGWFGQESPEAILMQSQTIPGIGVITTHNYSIDQLKSEARNGLREGFGTNMQLQGNLEDLADNAIGGVFEGTLEGSNAKAYIIGIQNPYEDGLGVSIMIASYPNMFTDQHINSAKQLYSSFKFKEVDNSDLIQQWTTFFSNVKLTYMDSYSSSTGGGYSSEEVIDLCRQGHFIFNSNNDMSIGQSDFSAYSQSNSAGSGQWEITMGSSGQPNLILKYYNGSYDEYEITYEDEEVYLNGYRYFRTTDGEYAPSCY